MEEKIRKKCKMYGVDYNVLTEQEIAEVRKEIEMEERGSSMSDSILSNPKLLFREQPTH